MDDWSSPTEYDSQDFNFWPSFSDLMLAIVLILLIMLFAYTLYLQIGSINLKQVQDNQTELVNDIAGYYKVGPKKISDNIYSISGEIMISNELTLQRITFADNILFSKDDYKLSKQGESTLKTIGGLVKSRLGSIREIQIQGHADTDKSGRFASNLELASRRAIEVFKFLQEQASINPAEHLMSATTFGEYKPVSRSEVDLKYDETTLKEANIDEMKKKKNRRIELLLFYIR